MGQEPGSDDWSIEVVPSFSSGSALSHRQFVLALVHVDGQMRTKSRFDWAVSCQSGRVEIRDCRVDIDHGFGRNTWYSISGDNYGVSRRAFLGFDLLVLHQQSPGISGPFAPGSNSRVSGNGFGAYLGVVSSSPCSRGSRFAFGELTEAKLTLLLVLSGRAKLCVRPGGDSRVVTSDTDRVVTLRPTRR